MSRRDCNYSEFDYEDEYNSWWGDCRRRRRRPQCCCCEGPRGPRGLSAYEVAVANGFIGTEEQWLESLKGEPGPFLSCFMEAVGTTQLIANDENFVFDTSAAALDTAGTGIELNAGGTVFTISKPGLYHVEWSINVDTGTSPLIVGLLENGLPSSALTNVSTSGNHSSGALINVASAVPPVTLSLHNFSSNPITISNPMTAQNTAASIRIARFADGSSV